MSTRSPMRTARESPGIRWRFSSACTYRLIAAVSLACPARRIGGSSITSARLAILTRIIRPPYRAQHIADLAERRARAHGVENRFHQRRVGLAGRRLQCRERSLHVARCTSLAQIRDAPLLLLGEPR